MSNIMLVIGESGSGKSTSIRNLDPKETFILNVLDKPLPFKGYKKHYLPIKSWEDKEGNYLASDDFDRIIKCIRVISNNRPDIKTLILDDWQYTMCNEFMRRASEKGYEKFTEIGKNAWSIVKELTVCREDLDCFVLSHNDTDNFGRSRCKSIGKMLDDKITIEGMFTTVLHTVVMDGQYKFLTQVDASHTAKSPMGMFEDRYIDNDLSIVKDAMFHYYNEDVDL